MKEITKKMVEQELIEIGVKPSFTGFAQLRDVIIECYNNEDYIYKFIKGPLTIIAERYGKRTNVIERNIRGAIEKTFENCDPDRIYNYFGNTVDFNKAKLANRDFVALVVLKLRWKYDET